MFAYSKDARGQPFHMSHMMPFQTYSNRRTLGVSTAGM